MVKFWVETALSSDAAIVSGCQLSGERRVHV
jgi:hypothetical protein